MKLSINGTVHELDVPPEMPLLWVLRDLLVLTGTKFGCGIGYCGVCTVHFDGAPARACVLPVRTCVGHDITTIEGLSAAGDHPLQQAWQAVNAPQCGYCQPGQIMHAAALLATNLTPSEQDITQHMSAVLCRCGTYPRIHQAVALAAKNMAAGES